MRVLDKRITNRSIALVSFGHDSLIGMLISKSIENEHFMSGFEAWLTVAYELVLAPVAH